jgi:RES domain-containing protein
VLTARGRWNRAGQYGCLYLALTPEGALAEREQFAAQAALSGLPFGPHELVSIDVTIVDGALDLTDPATQRRFGIATDQLRADGAAAYERCRSIADIARAEGHFVLFVPSAPLDGATNVVIYHDVPPASCRLSAGPDRFPIA